jgi:hypothetical protein
MSGINIRKVVVGGVVAGIVMNVIDGIVNGGILGSQWEAAARARNIDVAAVGNQALAGWLLTDFLMGLALVWLYAAIRPRFGPGPKTAVIASMAVWAISRIAYFSFAFTGTYPLGLVVISAAGALVGWLIGGYIGCRMYQETGTRRTAAV